MRMKKFINDPENLTPELLEGFAEAHKELVELGDQRMVINRKLPDADRVTIVTQGGSGHEPAISGFVGEGMVDISVVGDVFAAPKRTRARASPTVSPTRNCSTTAPT